MGLSAYDQHRNRAAANPELFALPRELLGMVLEPERLLRTEEGVFGSGKPTYSPTTVEICEKFHQIRAEKLTHMQ